MKIQLLILAFLGYAKCWPGILEKSATCGLSESISLFDKLITTRSISEKENLIFMTEFARFMNYKAPHLLQEFAERKKVSETKEKLRQLQFETNLYQALARRQRPKRSYEIQGRQDVVDTVVDAVEDTGDVAVDVIEGAGEVVEGVVEGAGEVVEEVADVAGDVADVVVDGAGDVIDAAVDAVEDTGDAVGDLGAAAADLTSGVINALTNSTTGIIDIFTDIVGSVGNVLEETLPPTVWNYVCVATWWPIHEDHCTATRCVACSPAITTAASVCRKTGQKTTHKCLQVVMGEGDCNYCIKEYLE